MLTLAEGCRRVLPVIVEDDDAEWSFITDVLMDRWGDRRVPKALISQSEALHSPFSF